MNIDINMNPCLFCLMEVFVKVRNSKIQMRLNLKKAPERRFNLWSWPQTHSKQKQAAFLESKK